jgi:hypothetical protein
LLSKSLKLVRIEQEPVRVFVSVQFHRRFQFHKRGQLFIGAHNELLSVVAMRVSNEAVRRGENPRCGPDIFSSVSFD